MAGAIKVDQSKGGQNRTLRSGPPNMHLLSLQRATQRAGASLFEQLHRQNHQIPLDGEAFPAQPEWAATTRLLFEASGFDFNGPPVRRNRATLRITGDPEAVVNVRDLLEEEPAEEPVMLSFDPGPVIWEELDDITPEPEEPPSPGLELYEPPEPEILDLAAEPDLQTSLGSAPFTAITEQTLEHVLLAPEDEPYEEQDQVEPEPESTDSDLIEAVALAPALEIELPQLRPLDLTEPSLPAEPLVASGSRLQLPSVEYEPLRPRMVLDAPPAPPKQASQQNTPPSDKAATPEPTAAVAAAPAPASAAQPASDPAPAQDRKLSKKAKKRRALAESPIEEPASLGEDVEASLQAAAVNLPEAVAARHSRADLQRAGETQTLAGALPSFGEPSLEPPSSGIGLKIGIAVGLLSLVGGALYFFLGSGPSSPKKVAVSGVSVPAVATAGLVIGESGWSSDYSTDSAGRRVRQISLYRPTVPVSDYRVEFQGEVEFKALSWVVRGASTKSYYVCKIVPEKGNGSRFIRFPVIDGQPGPPVSKPLPFATSLGTTYRVRADVFGPYFSVSIQDNKIDQWTETKLPTGGFGVANEGVERGQVRNIQVWHLRQATR